MMALRDAQAGIVYEGEDLPQPTDDDLLALRGFAMLANGMGGIDWAGLEVVVEILQIEDVEHFVDQITVLKLHNPKIEPDD